MVLRSRWPLHRWVVAVALLPILSAPVRGFISVGENVTLIPLPEIITDPNEGQTVGVLATLLFADESQHIKRMIAPDVRYNENTGVYPMFRWFEYLSDKQRFAVQAGKATKIGEYFEGVYSAEDLSDGWFDVRVRAFHENDPFERFFGFGNDTTSDAETNYTSDTGLLQGYVGVNLPANLQIGTQTRWCVVRLRNGAVDSVPQLLSEPSSAGVPGIDGATIVGQRFAVRYDTRDDPLISTQGGFADVGVEVVDRALGSSASYLKYGLEGRAFLPLRADKRYIVAGQAALDYMQGGDRAPFYDRSPLGGERSLRGFGSNRFIDNNRFFARGELRSNVWEPSWVVEQFKVRGHMEIAPFFEVGRVFASSRTFPLENPHLDGGVAFRAVMPPTLVAYVDVATAGGGATVFTGVDYPF
jgi:outer membrane protein assembly factor BamA